MIDHTQVIISVVTVAGVIASSGVIQFFVNRKDKQREDSRKAEYDELRKEFKEGLEERERIGKSRYEEHHEAIDKMSEQHKQDFEALKEAISKLTENDTKITESIESIAEKQGIMANSLVGQAHDRIMFLTEKITKRGCITNKEKATIRSMYDPYTSLGGNGEVKEAVEYVLKLDTVTDEVSKNRDLIVRGLEYREMMRKVDEHEK